MKVPYGGNWISSKRKSGRNGRLGNAEGADMLFRYAWYRVENVSTEDSDPYSGHNILVYGWPAGSRAPSAG